MSLRRATDDDAGTLAAIQEEASRAAVAHVYPPELYPFPADAVRERWERFTAEGGWAMLGDEGFVAIREPWLEAIYVRPAAWGSGLGVVLHDLRAWRSCAPPASRARASGCSRRTPARDASTSASAGRPTARAGSSSSRRTRSTRLRPRPRLSGGVLAGGAASPPARSLPATARAGGGC